MNLSLYKYSAHHSVSQPKIYIPKHIFEKKQLQKTNFKLRLLMNLSLYKYSAYHSMSLPTIYIPKHIF